MAGGRLIWPLIEPVLDASGNVVVGATLSVFQNRTAVLATLYADAALTTPVANPQTGANASNAAGRFFVQSKAFWAATGALYTMRVDRPDGTFDTIDDVQPQGSEITAAMIPGGSLSMDAAPKLSNNAGFPVTHISASVGRCRDSTDAADLILSAPTTKRLDQAWSVGTAGGARLSGSLGANQTWHFFLIMNPTTGVVDVGADQSPTAPALPTGYTLFRRLGAVLTDGTNAIRKFVQFDDFFQLALRSTDYANQVNNGGPFLRQVTVPNGIKVEARFYFIVVGTANLTAYLSGIFDPDEGIPPAFGAATQWAQVRHAGRKDTAGADVNADTTMVLQSTDANRNVYTFTSDPAELIALGVIGWYDRRGLG